MPPHRSRFLKRIAVIESLAPARLQQAERWIRGYYRVHRRLPRGAVACLLARRRLYAVIFLGELEHRLGLAPLLLRLAALRRRAAAVHARLRR